MKAFLLILVILVISGSAFASATPDDSVQTEQKFRRPWYSPHYIPVQYAGNIGFISAGVGYAARKDRYQLSLVYGYTPRAIAGARIHTLTGKNIFHLYRHHLNEKQTAIPYAALGLSAELGGRSFFVQPEHMPDKYYRFPKSVHAVASLGLKMRYMTPKIRGFQGVEFFVEATTIDAYIWYKFISKEVKMNDIVSAAFGMHLMRK